MRNYKYIPGINIQWPWSEHLVNRKKTIETRSYALPERFRGVELAIIETPGPKGKQSAGITKARIIGTIVFGDSHEYLTLADWMSEQDKHLVDPSDSQYAFTGQKPKWGWQVSRVRKFSKPISAPAKRGIIFAKRCKVWV